MPHILIVDGDVDSRTVFRVLLEHRGHRVTEAEDGETAWHCALADRPQAVVTELALRRLDGAALIARIRAEPATAAVPVVVVTARALAEEQRMAERAGCSLFLSKPVLPQALAAAIERLL